MKNWSECFWRERNPVTCTVLSIRYHCWSPGDNSSAFFLDRSRSLVRSEISLCVIWWSSAEVTFRKNSGSLEVDGCSFLGCILLFIITVYGKTVGGSGGRKWVSGIGRPSQWGTGPKVYLGTPVHSFSSWYPFLNRRHHREVAVCEVIFRFSSYHGNYQWRGTSLAIHPSVELWWTGRAAHMEISSCPVRLAI